MFYKKYRDVISGILLLALAAILYAASFGIRSIALSTIKASFFPRLDAALLTILGTTILVSGIRQARAYQPDPDEQPVAFWKDEGTRCLLLTLVLIALYASLLKSVGFIITTFFYLVAQMFVLAPREKRTKRNLILFTALSLITAFSVYFLFVKAFHLMLPAGILYL